MLNVNKLWIHHTEPSILTEVENSKYVPYFVGERSRFATCSGVSWFNGPKLAVVNLYGNHLRFYQFDPSSNEPLLLLAETTAGLSCPENVTVSPDGLTMAIAHSLSTAHGLSLHKVTNLPAERNLNGQMIRLGTYHGLDFSPDSRFLAVTEVAGKGSVEVIHSDTFESVCLLPHAYPDLKPKGISFSNDSLFVAIVYAANIQSSKQTGRFPLAIDVHEFDRAKGIIKSNPVASTVIEGADGASYENCSFLPTHSPQYSLLIASQADDQILTYIFCSTSQKITYAGICASHMSFPHGIDISEDGRYLAVTNYGDDTLRILDISYS